MLDEVAPVARVHRSRLAVAVAITLAALPLLVIDNLPATAEADENHVEASAAASSEAPSSTTASTARRVSASTTLAPTTTAAPATTVGPTTTVNAAEVVALRAPAPPAPAPTTTRPPTVTTRPATTAGDPNDPATWDRLAQCESAGNWAMSTGNGYYGGLQFSLGTWQNVGGSGYPHQASKAEQINRGKILQARAGWGQWPYCARQLGYL